MALYYFHLCDGQDTLLDPDGREISEIGLIPGLALNDARGIIAHDATEGSIKMNQSIDVLDAGGKLVHRLAFGDAVIINN